MKKRIISLILVVALAFLTLTGCAYNYAKDDMSDYATLDTKAFYDALQALSIKDGSFGTVEADRLVKVDDAIAQAILKVTDATAKKYQGKVEKYDSIYFCYYAEDGMGNVFFASKMDESKPTNIQLGLSTLSDFNKLVSDGLLTVEDIATHLYHTSSASVVGKGDVISLTYTKTWLDGTETKTEEKVQEYVVIGENDKLAEKLIGAPVGVELPEFKLTVTDTVSNADVEYTYTGTKVESIVKDNSTDKVADGDTVYVTYTLSFNAAPWLNEETGKYDLPVEFSPENVDKEGNYKCTYSYKVEDVVADAEGTAADAKTFLGQLVGKNVGSTTSSITVKNGTVGEKNDVELTYTNVKINWIQKTDNAGFTVKYTPYDEELKEDNSNKKTESNVKGDKVILNGVELTYHIFPVYYLDVADLSAELIVREFYSTLAATQTVEHDHTEEEHEHETEYVFDTLNDTEYKNGDKTLADLVKELVTLNSTLTTKEKAETEALKALTTAQSNLAKDTSAEDSADKVSLKTKLTNAQTAYLTAKTEADNAEKDVEEKITAILACKKGETVVTDALVADYETYQYDTLETAYKAELNKNVATAVIEYLNKNVKFEGNLPKRAVKNAYDAIMNTYKYDFYEGKYSSGSSTTSTSTETNFAHYNGDFDAYLLDKVVSNKGDMKAVKAAIQEEAEETVKDIILIYVFADAVEEKWGEDVTLTKDEKKTIKKNLENTALLYQQYGLSFSYNLDDSYHAGQFDKVMNFLLEVEESEDDTTNDVVYKHIVVNPETEDK